MTEANRDNERQNDDSNEPGIEEFDEYEVESILDHRRHKNQLQYNVKWVGYTETSWISEANTYCPDLLKNYCKTKPISQRPRKYKNLKKIRWQTK